MAASSQTRRNTRTDKINVFRPRTLADLLSLKQRRPDVVLFAGGTYVLYADTKKYPAIAPAVASIRHLGELKRIHRTERHIELGSCVSLSEIAHIGGRAVPPALSQAIGSIASAPVRSLATIGGNICVRENRITLFPVLHALETRLELRSHGGSRWIPISRFVGSDGELDMSDTEVLTRLRIPLVDWNYQYHRRLTTGPVSNSQSLSFCGVANTDRGILTDFRVVFGSIGKGLLWNRAIEAALVSRKVPMLERELNAVCRDFEDYVKASSDGLLSPFQATMAQRMFRWFLSLIEE